MDRFHGDGQWRRVAGTTLRTASGITCGAGKNCPRWIIAGNPAAMKFMNQTLAGVLLSTAFVACEKQQDDQGQPLIYRGCVVNWSGTLTTDSAAFNVRACSNGRCTSNINIPVQVARNDGGSVVEYPDAGCVPTTLGGPPSRCESLPFMPGPGCSIGEIGNDFSVLACARSGSNGTYFSVTLTPATESLAGDGDQVGLTIETTAGNTLIEANANVLRNDTESSTRCLGSFDLDGNSRIGGG